MWLSAQAFSFHNGWIHPLWAHYLGKCKRFPVREGRSWAACSLEGQPRGSLGFSALAKATQGDKLQDTQVWASAGLLSIPALGRGVAVTQSPCQGWKVPSGGWVRPREAGFNRKPKNRFGHCSPCFSVCCAEKAEGSCPGQRVQVPAWHPFSPYSLLI